MAFMTLMTRHMAAWDSVDKKMPGLLEKPGLYANIAAKKRRISAQKAAGKTPERMRKKGDKGAPTDSDFKAAAKTAK